MDNMDGYELLERNPYRWKISAIFTFIFLTAKNGIGLRKNFPDWDLGAAGFVLPNTIFN